MVLGMVLNLLVEVFVLGERRQLWHLMPTNHVQGPITGKPVRRFLRKEDRGLGMYMVVVGKHFTCLLIVVWWLKSNHLTAKDYFCCSPSNVNQV